MEQHSRKGENCCGNMHCLSVVTRSTNPKKLKIPIIREQECYLQGSSSHQAGDKSSGAWACPGMGLLMYFLQHHTLQSVPGIQQRSELWVPRQSSNYPAMWDLHGITLFPPEFAAASSHRPHIGEEGKKVPAWKGRGGVEQEDPGAGYLWSSYSVSRRSLQ